MSPAIATENPFPGLRSFTPDRSDLFFGRDREIERLIERLRVRRFLAVVGVSGSGKSSLVRAGLIPRLQDGYMIGSGRQWRVVIMRPGNDPSSELARSLASSLGLTEDHVRKRLQVSSRGLVAVCAESFGESGNVLLLVDQFEELIRYRPPQCWEGARAFVELLLAAVGRGALDDGDNKGPAIFVVITMRSEYLGKCALFPGLAEALNDGQFLVPPMERSQVRMAIEGPVRMAAGRIAPNLVQQLLNEASGETDRLPLLQHALTLLWETSKGRAMGFDDYLPLGGDLVSILNQAADRALALAGGERILRRLFQRLVEPGLSEDEVRRPTRLSELVEVTGAAREDLLALTKPLRDRGYIDISADADPTIDVTHESLIRQWRTLNGWVQQESRNARLYRRLAETEAGGGAPYRGTDLESAIKWEKAEQPNAAWADRYPIENGSFEKAVGFLHRSRKANRRDRVLRASLAGLVVGLAITAVSFGWRANSLRSAAVTQRLTAQAEALATGPSHLTQVSLLLAIESLKRQPSAEADAAVRKISKQVPIFVSQMKHAGPVTSLQFSDDGSVLASGSDDKTLGLWEVKSGKQLAVLRRSRQVREIRLDTARGYLAAREGDLAPRRIKGAKPGPGAVTVWKVDSSWTPHELLESAFTAPVRAWTLSGERLIASDGETLRTESLNVPETIEAKISFKAERLALAPNGDHLLMANQRSVQLCEVAKGGCRAVPFDPEHESRLVPQVRFSADGRSFYIAGRSFVEQRDLISLAPLGKVKDASGSFALNNNGRLVAITDGFEGNTEVYDFRAHEIVGQADEPSGSRPEGTFWIDLAFSNDSRRLAFNTAEGGVRVFTIQPWGEIFRIGLDRRTTRLAWSRDGDTLAVGSSDGLITVWRLGDTSSAWSLPARKLSVSPKRSYWLIVSDPDHARLVDRLRQLLTSIQGEDFIFSSDDHFLAAVGRDGATVTTYELPRGRLLPPLYFAKNSPILALAFSPPDSLWTVASSGLLVEWRVSTGQARKTVHLGRFSGLSKDDGPGMWQAGFSPRAEICAVNFRESGGVTLLQPRSGQRLCNLPIQFFWHIRFSPDSQLVAGIPISGNYLAVWNTQTCKELWRDNVPEFDVKFEFDATGSRLAAGVDHVLRVWDAQSGKVVLSFDDQTSEVAAVLFDPSNEYLATWWTNGRGRVWRLQDGVQVNDFRAPAEVAENPGLLFSPGGSWFVIAADKAYHALWWRPADVIREACRHVASNLSPEEWQREVRDGRPADTCSLGH